MAYTCRRILIFKKAFYSTEQPLTMQLFTVKLPEITNPSPHHAPGLVVSE